MELTFEGETVLVTNESGEAVALTPEDVSTLAINAHKILDELTLRGLGIGQQTVATRQISSVSVTLDVHKTDVVLLLEFEDGTKIGYTGGLALARELRDSLANKVKQIEAAQKGRTNQ